MSAAPIVREIVYRDSEGRNCIAHVNAEGTAQVAVELFDEMMTDLGWVKTADYPFPEADR